jgi:hypothetical protein
LEALVEGNLCQNRQTNSDLSVPDLVEAGAVTVQALAVQTQTLNYLALERVVQIAALGTEKLASDSDL